MEVYKEQNEKWKKLIEEKINNNELFNDNPIKEYLSKWEFVHLEYEDLFEEDETKEYECEDEMEEERMHCGIRSWQIELDGKMVEFRKKENYTYMDIHEKWTMDEEIDFVDYLIEKYELNGYQLETVLYVIDVIIQDI